MKKGLFITFEGIDGCGKTTQLELLKKYLDEKNIGCIKTLEPGAAGLGEKLREILLHYDKPVSDRAETFIFLADRAQHVEFTLKPALNEGKIVLCDRYTDSTICYQGYARGGNIEELKKMNEIATEGLKPDLTFVFDLPPESAQKRVGKIKDRLEKEDIGFHKKLQKGYLEIAKFEPERVKIINADDSIENIHKKVLEQICGLL
ncbi:MAG: dTMP kinase [Candidatus Gastranaerophilales bacterium]|nr:dTMP kinase [Candidatus Gastranaerophilales bacterium]